MLIAFMVFLIFSAFVVPVFAECSAASLTPQDPAIDLSLSDWLFGNMIAGLVIFFLLIAVSKQNGKDNDCGYAIFLTVASLYCVFEVIWSVIGFCIYGEYYKDACAL
jgi:type II secretory pathway component PulF